MSNDGRKKKVLINEDKRAPLQKISLAEQLTAVQTPTVDPQNQTQNKPSTDVPSKSATATPEVRAGFQRPESISITAPKAGLNVAGQANTLAESATQYTPTTPTNKPFTTTDLEQAWIKFAEVVSDNGRLKSIITSSRPQLISEKEFVITVANILQEKDLQRIQAQLMTFLHKQLANSAVRMSIKLMVETEKTRGTSPEERYNMMASQNPALSKLRSGLNLEID